MALGQTLNGRFDYPVRLASTVNFGRGSGLDPLDVILETPPLGGTLDTHCLERYAQPLDVLLREDFSLSAGLALDPQFFEASGLLGDDAIGVTEASREQVRLVHGLRKKGCGSALLFSHRFPVDLDLLLLLG